MKTYIIVYCVLVFFNARFNIEAVQDKQNVDQRQKRDLDYGWGYADWSSPVETFSHDGRLSEQLVQTTTQAPAPATSVSTYRPCDPYNPILPDFSAPNRRLSEVKCYEHIWNLKTRIVKDKRTIDCTVENLRKKNSYAVIGGRDAVTGEFAHMAAIGWRATSGGRWIFKCGGSLLSANVVLTAGHCIKASSLDTSIAETDPKIVRLGDKNILDPDYRRETVDVKISTIVQHPLYMSPKKYNDIALMLLERPVEFKETVHPACLWPYFDTGNLGTKATVTGWGVVKSGDTETSPKLQAAVVDLIPSNQCNQLLERFCNRNWCGLEDHQICAGTLAGGADSCQGDSGGPLQVKIPLPNNTLGYIHYVIGVTSFGVQCGRANAPGVYTRVSSYIDWIESIVWPQEFARYSQYNMNRNNFNQNPPY